MKKITSLLIYLLITSSISYAGENDFILGVGQKLKLTMITFNPKYAELIDLDSIKIVDNNINIERHRRYYGEHIWANQALLSNETFNCENNTITSNLTYLYPYHINGMDQLTPTPFPRKGSVTRGDNTLQVLCKAFWLQSDKTNAEKEEWIKETLILFSNDVILSAPMDAFSYPELISITFNDKGEVVNSEDTDLLRYIKKNKAAP